jgi:hypothetical protein
MNQIIHAIQKSVQVRDCVKFLCDNDHSLGQVVSSHAARESVQLFKNMHSATLQRFCLKHIINIEEHPLGSQDKFLKFTKH